MWLLFFSATKSEPGFKKKKRREEKKSVACMFAFPLLSVKLPTHTQAHTPLTCQHAKLDADSGFFFLFYLLKALDYHIMEYVLHLELYCIEIWTLKLFFLFLLRHRVTSMLSTGLFLIWSNQIHCSSNTVYYIVSLICWYQWAWCGDFQTVAHSLLIDYFVALGFSINCRSNKIRWF